MSESNKTKTLEAKCFCGSVHYTIDVPVASLPLTVHLCHCSVCRYGSGAPCIFHTPLPPGVVPKFIEPSSEANMTSYLLGEGVDTWNFCSTCGCHITAIGVECGNWTASSSIFVDHGPDNFLIRKHNFSKSAKDGGIAKTLTHNRGTDFIDWNPPDDDPTAKIVESQPEPVGQDGQERLRAKCYCGGVSFTIQRPTQEVLDDEYMSKFIFPDDQTRWSATLDACDDCRLLNGTHVVGWTFIPLALCEPPIKPDLLIGTAKTYRSSADVLRSFCGTCGSTLFYSCEDRRPSDKQQIVDLATGVLRAPEGSMADNWLTWRARTGWMDSGKRYDAGFHEALQEGMNKWILKKEGKITDYNLG
ncbi:hypothetical protein G7046_g4771 [Stylonectria norvegica]|nr:hypothetical protein G7046_g4771 [Stylonectria norvegica]